LHAFLARQLAERNRQNKDSETELVQTLTMIARQRTEIEALQRKGSDLKKQIQELRMASCSSN
jgi:predicted RNase H-like nuclease (RuvC/YqgF family)